MHLWVLGAGTEIALPGPMEMQNLHDRAAGLESELRGQATDRELAGLDAEIAAIEAGRRPWLSLILTALLVVALLVAIALVGGRA